MSLNLFFVENNFGNFQPRDRAAVGKLPQARRAAPGRVKRFTHGLRRD